MAPETIPSGIYGFAHALTDDIEAGKVCYLLAQIGVGAAGDLLLSHVGARVAFCEFMFARVCNMHGLISDPGLWEKVPSLAFRMRTRIDSEFPHHRSANERVPGGAVAPRFSRSALPLVGRWIRLSGPLLMRLLCRMMAHYRSLAVFDRLCAVLVQDGYPRTPRGPGPVGSTSYGARAPFPARAAPFGFSTCCHTSWICPTPFVYDGGTATWGLSPLGLWRMALRCVLLLLFRRLLRRMCG